MLLFKKISKSPGGYFAIETVVMAIKTIPVGM